MTFLTVIDRATDETIVDRHPVPLAYRETHKRTGPGTYVAWNPMSCQHLSDRQYLTILHK